ncbi:hypothetical protein Acr_27g0007150 [Actinidia rufa]|uniref:Uncharacterized protein n=1 Tax=Actinidia rufa TaxID=165716 RepID=A0A7J0H7C2_9ERIC|nr:hypothetical protein Acr_27g0007150 [Actinidia rufa]
MAGLLAWAADVVGGGGPSNDEDDTNSIPVAFTPEQQQYVRELDRKSASLSRSIQDLRLRLPPPDISQRLPHLHAHSLASNAALALQLNAHSATKQQAQLREVTLQEENAAYEKAISVCESKMREKLQEADVLRIKFQEMDLTEENLKAELDNALQDSRQCGKSGQLSRHLETTIEAQEDTDASNSDLLDKLENKKKELCSIEERVQDLEKKMGAGPRECTEAAFSWSEREAQAEGLVSEIHLKEMELERLNELWKRLDTSTVEVNAARNRLGRSNPEKGSLSSDYIVDPHQRPRTELQQRLMLARSAFVLYILALHIMVFIKISF